MSDTHTVDTTPPPAAPPTTAPTEVPVNEAPVASQSPLGQQAPPKPEGQESNKSSQISRREAIQNAFRRSAESQAEATKTASERSKTPQKRGADDADDADAKKQPQSAKPPQHREAGRFARDPNKPTADQQQPPADPQQQRFKPLDQNAPFREPPRRFDDRAKAEWAGAPESVRGAVERMSREFQGAYERFRGDYETMETLRPYHDLATKQGTTLERAFTNYYQMEQKLRQDLVGGLDLIVNNMKLKASDGSPITLRDVAWHIMNMSPEQHRLSAQQNQQTAADMRIGELHKIVEQQSKQIGELIHKQRVTDTLEDVNKFAKTHPRLDELSTAIKQELDLGFPLDVAYRRAELLNPPTQAAQTRNASAQTRRTSISGAPDGNGKGAISARPSDGQRKPNGEDKHPTRREALAKAMRRVSNGV